MGLLMGGGLLPMFGASGVTYLLSDEFTTDRAAGAVNGTAAEPGPGGNRAVSDSGNKLSISSGKLALASGGSNFNPYLIYDSVVRAAGRLMIAKLDTFTTDRVQFGFTLTTNLASDRIATFDLGNGFVAFVPTVAAGTKIIRSTSAVNERFIIALRATGSVALIANKIVWVADLDSSAALRPFICNMGSTTNIQIADVKVPATTWLPTPLVSDGFGSAFGTTDGLGHAEGIAGGVGSGGSGVTWTTHAGTIGVTSAKAQASALSGGVANATLSTSTKNVFVKAKLTRSAGAVGLELRRTDDDNKLFTEHDGTNCYLKQRVAGVETTLITAAATYSANAEVMSDLDGNAGRLYYNNALVGTTASINAGLTATAHGIRTTDTGNTIDDFVVYAKGSGGEYAALDNY